MNIKVNSDDKLPMNDIEIPSMIIVVRSTFH